MDRALEMTAKRQFENEQGAAKLAEWLVDEMKKKRNAERKIKSLLLRCKYVSAGKNAIGVVSSYCAHFSG
jgi:hypothetical protein